MGRRGGPGVGRGQIAVGGLRTSLRRRGKRRGKIEGGGVGGVGGGGVGVGGVGVEGGGGGGVDPRTKLVLLVVESRWELVGGEGGGVVVVLVGRADGGGGVGGSGEPGGVLGVEGGKRSATRVGEMMISERMDWRELHAIVGGRSGIERDPLPLVLAEGGGRRVRGVGSLDVLPGEGGSVGVDRVCGGGHGSGGGRIGGTGQLSSTRPAEGRSTLYSL